MPGKTKKKKKKKKKRRLDVLADEDAVPPTAGPEDSAPDVPAAGCAPVRDVTDATTKGMVFISRHCLWYV